MLVQGQDLPGHALGPQAKALTVAAAPGRPKQGTAPSGGSAAHEVASVGATLFPAEAIWQVVVPVLPGFTVEVLPQIDSTNTELMRRAKAGQLDPVLLVAERQTAGRGRLGRQWHSEQMTAPTLATACAALEVRVPEALALRAVPMCAGTSGAAALRPEGANSPWGGPAGNYPLPLSSLTFSLGLPLAPVNWSGLSLAVGVSVAQSLHPALRLKWPNDIWLQDRKLGGILIETGRFGDVRYVVIGVGINLNARDANGLSMPPAWLAEVQPAMDAGRALQQVAAPLVRAVQTFEAQGFAPFQARFNALDLLAGRAVVCSDGTVGEALGVDGDGALLVQTAAGLRKITSAEVSVRPAVVDGLATAPGTSPC